MPIELFWIACVLVAGVGTLIFGLVSGEKLPAQSHGRHTLPQVERRPRKADGSI